MGRLSKRKSHRGKLQIKRPRVNICAWAFSVHQHITGDGLGWTGEALVEARIKAAKEGHTPCGSCRVCKTLKETGLRGGSDGGSS